MSEKFGTLTERLVHPTAPVLLIKNSPLRVHVRVIQFTSIFTLILKETETTYPLKV